MNKKRLALCSVVISSAALCLVAAFRMGAATPGVGTITPNSSPLSWDGSGALGVSATGEMTCVEQPGVAVNCDTFTLTVLGTPAEWAGKQVDVSISWVVLASDYDLYLHKGDNNGPLIGSSTGGAPGTNETVAIEPGDLDASGSTVFSVHVVYSAAAAGDQYRGTATVVTAAGGPTPTPAAFTKSKNWKINYHGTCCEGNLAAAGNNTYVLLPVLVNGNKIKRSTDGGQTWEETYPPAPLSFPYGIEGDMQAFGNDAIFFGTELADAVVARSEQGGAKDTWTTTQAALASGGNDQAWAYLGPFGGLRPGGALPTDKPYTLAGWMRIGTAIAFSFDGGLTFTAQTPLVGNNGSGPEHVVCHQNAAPPVSPDPGDTRIADQLFKNQKSGRHGTWGTDRKFYWTETIQDTSPGVDTLYVCQTSDFGVNWTGNKHPVSPGPGSGFVVSHSAFDNNGTLYVLHGNKLYVSFNQGKTFAFTHTLPRYGNAGRADSGADQYFAVHCGTVHIGLLEDAGEGRGRVFYLRGSRVDTAQPTWDQELVDEVGNVRLDFVYIVLDGNNIPTISYTTPEEEVTTASRNAPMPALGAGSCGLVSVSAVSRKTHAPNKTFDVPLPLDGPAGIECRTGTGGSGNAHEIVVSLGLAASFANVAVEPASEKSAELDGMPTTSGGNTQISIKLKNVSDAQTVKVILQGVSVAGGTPSNLEIPIYFLAGDTSEDGRVNITDTNQTKSRTGTVADQNNFRSDVNLDGRINIADTNFVKAHAGSDPADSVRTNALRSSAW